MIRRIKEKMSYLLSTFPSRYWQVSIRTSTRRDPYSSKLQNISKITHV